MGLLTVPIHTSKKHKNNPAHLKRDAPGYPGEGDSVASLSLIRFMLMTKRSSKGLIRFMLMTKMVTSTIGINASA